MQDRFEPDWISKSVQPDAPTTSSSSTLELLAHNTGEVNSSETTSLDARGPMLDDQPRLSEELLPPHAHLQLVDQLVLSSAPVNAVALVLQPAAAPSPAPQLMPTPSPGHPHNFRGRLLDTPGRRMPMLSARHPHATPYHVFISCSARGGVEDHPGSLRRRCLCARHRVVLPTLTRFDPPTRCAQPVKISRRTSTHVSRLHTSATIASSFASHSIWHSSRRLASTTSPRRRLPALARASCSTQAARASATESMCTTTRRLRDVRAASQSPLQPPCPHARRTRTACAVTLSAALRQDYWAWGYNNAPGTTNGAPDYNYPQYNGLPTTPPERVPENSFDRMLPLRRGFTLNIRRWSPRTRACSATACALPPRVLCHRACSAAARACVLLRAACPREHEGVSDLALRAVRVYACRRC